MSALTSVLTCVSWVLWEADPQEELGSQGFTELAGANSKELAELRQAVQSLGGLESRRRVYSFVENLSLEEVVTGFVFKPFKYLLIMYFFKMFFLYRNVYLRDFSGGPVVKNPPARVGDVGSIPLLGRFCIPRCTKPMHYSY